MVRKGIVIQMERVLIASLALIVSCGGMAPGGEETPPDTPVSESALTLTGRVDVPPLEALPSLQKRMSSIKASMEGDATEGIKGDIHTLTGKHLGSFETNSEGEYQVVVPPEELSADASEEVILTTTSGIQQYQTIHYNGTGYETINLGTADIVTTLATEGIISQLDGFNGWGNGELECLYHIEENMWTHADSNAQTLVKNFGLLKEAVVSLLAQKKGSADPVYDNWHEVLNSVLTGKIDGSQALDMVNAEEFDFNSLTAHHEGEAGDVYNEVENLLKALIEEDTASGSEGNATLCGKMADGALDPAVVISPIFEAEDLEELQETYSDESAVKVHVALMQDCASEDGCAEMKEDAETIVEVMKALDYTEMFDDEGELDKAGLKEIVTAAKTCETGFQKSDCVKGKITEVHEKKKGDEEKPKVEEDPLPPPPPPEAKVTICHLPPGNPANLQTIEVASSALKAHLEHGDYEGECVEEDPPPPPSPPPPEAKVTICHLPPENPANLQTIEVAVSAVAAHLAHGDYEGACVVDPPDLSEITVLWNYTFGHIYGGFYRMIPGPSAAIGQVRPDLPGFEIATGNEEYHPLGYSGGAPQGRWFLFQSDGTVEFWKDTENDEAHSSVNLYDLNDDGRLEILGGTTSGNQVQAFDGEGNWFWRYFLNGHSISTPTVATLTPDGDPVVFNGCMDNHVRSIDGRTGHLNWAFNSGRWIWSTPAVADLDGDDEMEVVIANDGQYTGAGVLYRLSAETGTVEWQTNLAGKVRASPATADVDGDGVLEVLIGDGSGLFKAFNGETGALKWSFVTGGEILSSAAVGDLDGDGDLETVFGSADGRVYALHGDGSLFWSRNLGGAVHSSPALAKRNPGLVLDVYVATMSGNFEIISGLDGSRISHLEVGYEVVSSPVVGDVDGDGKLEVFFQDRRADTLSVMAGDVFWAVRDEDSSVYPFAREWPVFRGNPAHTGVYSGNNAE